MSQSWSKPTRYFALILVLAGLIWFLIAARRLVSPLVVAALLAYILNPIVDFFHNRAKLKRQWVAVLVFVVAIASLAAITVTFFPLLPEQIRILAEDLQEFEEQLRANLANPIIVLGFSVPLNQMLGEFGSLSSTFIRTDVILGALQIASTNLVWVLVIMITTYYLLQDWPLLRNWLLDLAPAPYQSDINRLYGEITTVWNRYLRGQLVLMFIMGVTTGLALAAIGLPSAAIIGLLAGALDAILSVGPTIAMVIAAVIAWVAGSTYLPISNGWFALLVITVFTSIQIAENIWLRPQVIGNSLRIHPAIVLIGVVGALALAGVLVALIIIPILSSAAIIGRYLYCKILDIEPWPTTS